MHKKFYIILLSLLTINSYALTSNKNMDFDFSEEMIAEKKEKAEFEITVNKEDLIIKNNGIYKNGKVYPIGQFVSEIKLESNIKKLDESSKILNVEEKKDIGTNNFIIQFAWHMNEDKNIWLQFFIEEFDNNVESVDGVLVNENGKGVENKLEPTVSKHNYIITTTTLDKKESIVKWNGYEFKINTRLK